MTQLHIGNRVAKNGRLAVGCSAAVFDPDREHILLVRRVDNGRWAVPGGYMEPGETVTEGCAREVLEESGMRVRVTRLIGVYTSTDIMIEYDDGNCLQPVVLHFEAEPIGGALRSSEETAEARFFTQEETATLGMGLLDRLRIEDGFDVREAAVIRDHFDLEQIRFFYGNVKYKGSDASAQNS